MVQIHLFNCVPLGVVEDMQLLLRIHTNAKQNCLRLCPLVTLTLANIILTSFILLLILFVCM